MIHHLTENSIAVEVPEGSKDFNLIPDFSSLYYKTEDSGEYFRSIPLGDKFYPNQWQILGRAEQVTEEQAKQIVEGYIYSGRISFQAYRNYVKPVAESMEDIFSDPKESFHSLLKSKNVPIDNVIISVKAK